MLLGFGVSAMKRREFITLLGGVAVAWAFDFEAQAQQFPTQPIHLILGFAPGGITDFTGRVVAQRLSKILGGNPVVPENRPGAAGVNAATAVAHSRADGYTLILIDSGTVVNPMLRMRVTECPTSRWSEWLGPPPWSSSPRTIWR
jgi:tripartite-type tricarboxylate transporter receptor subunit TctC